MSRYGLQVLSVFMTLCEHVSVLFHPYFCLGKSDHSLTVTGLLGVSSSVAVALCSAFFSLYVIMLLCKSEKN